MVINDWLASYSLINLNFLLPETSQFDKRIILQFIAFKTSGFLLSVFFLPFKQQNNIAL